MCWTHECTQYGHRRRTVLHHLRCKNWYCAPTHNTQTHTHTTDPSNPCNFLLIWIPNAFPIVPSAQVKLSLSMPERLHHAMQRKTCLGTAQIYPGEVMFNFCYQTGEKRKGSKVVILLYDELVIVTDKRKISVLCKVKTQTLSGQKVFQCADNLCSTDKSLCFFFGLCGW